MSSTQQPGDPTWVDLYTADLDRASEYGAAGVLLDAHAPGVYGGTGETFDWAVASAFRRAITSRMPASRIPRSAMGGMVRRGCRSVQRAPRRSC